MEPKAKILFLFIAISLNVTSYGQQFEFVKRQLDYNYLHYASFDKRFEEEPATSIKMGKASFYKEKKVKSIRIYNSANKLKFLIDLDTNGTVWRSGYFAGDYFKVESSMYTANGYTSTLNFYKDSFFVKSDTSIYTNFSYRNKDTSMYYKRVHKKTYKTGALLNEQNNYFNERYLHKKLDFSKSMVLTVIPNRKRFGRKHVYLKTKLKCDFEPNRLYCSKEIKDNEEAYFLKDSGRTVIDTLKLKKHSFYKSYCAGRKIKMQLSGESFIEPIEYYVPFRCGQSYHDDIVLEEMTSQRYEFTTNEKGLYNSYVNLYYPKDTSRAAAEKYKASLNIAPGEITVIYPGRHPYPRSNTPIKETMYYIRYEYFN